MEVQALSQSKKEQQDIHAPSIVATPSSSFNSTAFNGIQREKRELEKPTFGLPQQKMTYF